MAYRTNQRRRVYETEKRARFEVEPKQAMAFVDALRECLGMGRLEHETLRRAMLKEWTRRRAEF